MSDHTPRGAFRPIEDVIREAEDRAQSEWDREHQPCPHESVIHMLERRDGLCRDCGEWVAP